jgi:hypothetical protein
MVDKGTKWEGWDEWINLAQNGVQWQPLVSRTVNFFDAYNASNFFGG